MNAILVENLTKRYGTARGVEQISFSVEEGDFFGFIGPNGAGKSTTIRSMLGLIQATSGNSYLFGKEIRRTKEEILSQVGYLPSEAFFYDGMRVKDVLKLSADLRKKNCEREAADLLERLALDPNRKVKELSFGNRKKVAIIAALQHDPRLVILDEPTSGLDPLMQREFFRILTERNQKGTTVFLSSHILSEIQRYCKTAAIIREGKLIACDKVSELMKTKVKHVTVHGEADFAAVNGIHKYHKADDVSTFLYDGEISSLLSFLSNQKITDVSISDPDLEEIFMHYYTGEDGKEGM